MKSSLTLCAVALLLGVSTAQGQLPPQRGETLTATRSIDAVVTDHRGNRIRGLSQSDFEVVQDAKTQEITRFKELSRDAGAPDLDPPRKVILAFDISSLTMSGRKRAVEAARGFVKSRLRPVDGILVAEVSNVGAAMKVGQWTSDPAEIDKQLTIIEGRSAIDRSNARRTAEQNIQMAIDFDQQSATSGNPSLITFETLMQTGRQYAAEAQAETVRTVNAIQDIVTFFSEGPAKNIVILAGGGLATRPGSDIFTFLDALKRQAEMGQTGPGVQRGAKQANPRAEISRFSTQKDVTDVATTARNRGVRIYAFEPDTSGSTQLAVERRELSNSMVDYAGVSDQMSGYQVLSNDTGGLALIGGSAADAVNQISSDLDAHYTLTFQQTISTTAQLPRVEVKSTKAGYRVRSAFLGGPSSRESEIKDAVVANHRGEISSNDMKIALANDPVAVEGENKRVKLRVLIPVKSLTLVPSGSEVIGSFAVFVCSGDDKGNTGSVSRQVHDFHWPADAAPQMIDKTIGYAIELVVPSSRTQISVGVADQKSELTGYAKTAI